MKKRTRLRIIIGTLVVVALGVGIAVSVSKMRGPDRGIPTTRVIRGNVDLKVYTIGALRTPNTALLMGPPVGGTLQITLLARTGDEVKANDVVLEFDPSEQEYNLEQAQFALDQANQQLVKTKADGDISAANDQVALLHAKYDVRRAELDVSQNELDSAILAKKNDLALDEAKRRLAELQQDVQSRVASSRANLAVFEAQKAKAQLDISQAKQRISSLSIRAPISGLFVRKANTNGLFIFGPGMSVPEYQQGDQTFPGGVVASILDVTQMEVATQVPETARADINAGETADVVVDAMPEKTFPAKVKTVGGLASGGDFWFGADSTRKFDATFQMDQPDARLRPGETTHVIVHGEQLKNILYLPRQALFVQQGKPTVFVKAGRGFEPRVVNVKHMTENQVVVEGVNEGTEVALVNPEKGGTPSSPAPTTAGVKAGGK
ncbi:MAG TPA: HlyD family efflux transporter periplasmic adaptor subunit [Candidatus Acidoferrales bacterium]|nr:HlyD family efflux transporter periplasmic adaptor subunit [Candidatus Acidoferrales bacterium]